MINHKAIRARTWVLSAYHIRLDKDENGKLTFASELCHQVGRTVSDAIEQLIVQHALAGVNIEHPSYELGLVRMVDAYKKVPNEAAVINEVPQL